MNDPRALPVAAEAAALEAPPHVLGDPEAAQRRLEARLRSRIEHIDRVCKLTREQREKLNAAGRGDIKRAFARAKEIETKYAGLRPGVQNQRQLLIEVMGEQAELRRVMTEVDCFGEGSLFAKILPKTLTPEQRAIREKSMREAASAQHLSTIRWAAGSLALWLQLATEQRQKLESVLIARTHVPRRFGEYDYYGLLFQMSRLPEHDLKPIFNVEQWQKLERQFGEAKRLETVLRLGGYLPEEELARAGKTQRNNVKAEPEQPRIQAPDF